MLASYAWGLNLIPRVHVKKKKKLATVAHACNASTGEAETGGFLDSSHTCKHTYIEGKGERGKERKRRERLTKLVFKFF